MNEEIYFYHLDAQTQRVMAIILAQLDVPFKAIQEEDVHQPINYIIGKTTKRIDDSKEPMTCPDEPFLLFNNFNKDQTDLVMKLFENAKLPYIPYKGIVTKENCDRTFTKLFVDIKQEYHNLVHQINH